MFEGIPGIILAIMSILALLCLPFANYFFQGRANRSHEESLRHLPEEYNRMIRANAWRCFVRRGIWAAAFFYPAIANFINFRAISIPAKWFSLVFLVLGLGLLYWAIYGYKMELRRIIKFE